MPLKTFEAHHMKSTYKLFPTFLFCLASIPLLGRDIPEIKVELPAAKPAAAGKVPVKKEPAKDAETRKRERMERLHKAWMEEMEDKINRRKTANRTKMDLRIQFLERAVGLDEGQVGKLTLAKKGAVERATQAWLDFREKQWRAEQRSQYLRDQMDKNQVDPVMQDVWATALDSTLTSKQKRKYQAELGMRFIYFGNALLQSKLSAFDQQALLSRKQRQALDTKLQASLTIPIKDVSPKVVSIAVNKAFQRITLEEQQEILSNEQQAAWIRFISNINDSSGAWEHHQEAILGEDLFDVDF